MVSLSMRRSLHLNNFTNNSSAACLANKIADQLKNETCKNAFNFGSTPSTKPNVPKFDKIASEDNWMVVVLSTNTTTGNFSGAASLIANISMGNYMLALFLGLLLVSVS
uniref:Uncharacterized GPI-anchored protein At5g19230-like domain-containing protein n=1 Tax=Quercus lobata TaxID=97700 RepID=A0A7N2L3X3_QUELO